MPSDRSSSTCRYTPMPPHVPLARDTQVVHVRGPNVLAGGVQYERFLGKLTNTCLNHLRKPVIQCGLSCGAQRAEDHCCARALQAAAMRLQQQYAALAQQQQGLVQQHGQQPSSPMAASSCESEGAAAHLQGSFSGSDDELAFSPEQLRRYRPALRFALQSSCSPILGDLWIGACLELLSVHTQGMMCAPQRQ